MVFLYYVGNNRESWLTMEKGWKKTYDAYLSNRFLATVFAGSVVKRSYRPSRAYMNPFKMKVGGLQNNKKFNDQLNCSVK